MKVLVVGGGLEGLSIAYHLADRGCEVTVLERGELCACGTAKSSGVVRCHYTVRSLAAMAWYSVAEHERFGEAVGFHRVGYLIGVGPENEAALRHNVAMHQELGIDSHTIDHDGVRALWPAARIDDFAVFAHERRAGYGDAYQLGMAYAQLARRNGAAIRRHTPVARLTTNPVGIELVTGEQLGADLVVLAAGPWSRELAATVGLELPIQPQREEIVLVRPGRDSPDHPPVFGDLVSLQYIKPEPSGELLWGNADHTDPQYADPDHYSNGVDSELAAEKMAHRLPGLLDPRITGGYAGIYDVTPDFNPIIDRVGDGLFVAAGFSGHGFKLSPAVGRLVADMVIDGAPGIPHVHLHDFRLSRFADGAPLVGDHPYTTVRGHL
ncbi:NAD(P)/FAD-dependent oxidoreductase [Actinophytocola sp.]|uniref:NAD(P)/FAD-dependent oxidoreductase n=1 Tax=Actinophytocola sp. TaxID=1872138 RepID=UPI003D6BEA71